MNESEIADEQPSQGGAPPLTFDQCWELLAAANVGRLALVVDDHPEIFPVNYVLYDRNIVFRTDAGRKLWGAMASRPGAFEIDGYDAQATEAWSVMARGETVLMTDPQETAKVDQLGLEPWQPGAKSHYIRLIPRALTGRRFIVNRPNLWETNTNDARRALFE